MKIPTIFALILLSLISIVAIGSYSLIKNILLEEKEKLKPENIQVTNIHSVSATITWQSPKETTGEIVYDTELPLKVSRFSLTKAKYQTVKQDGPVKYTHEITLTNLNPSTKYYFYIKNGNSTYPDKPLEFITSKELKVADTPNKDNVVGKVVNTNLEPLTDALVILEVKGALLLSSSTYSQGYFIIPLSNLLAQDGNDFFRIPSNSEAQLNIFSKGIKSKVEITLPLNSQVLPPIVIGKDMDLRSYTASRSGELKI